MANKSFPSIIILKASDKASSVLKSAGARFDAFGKKLDSVSTKARTMGDRLGLTEKKLKGLGDKMTKFGIGMTAAITVPATLLADKSVEAFRVFEQGLIDVRKTTGLELDEIKSIILGIGDATPIAHDKLLEIAGAAGQLGVKGSENIRNFTETFAKLEKASDVVGEDGAKAVVRLLNVTGDGIGKVKQFASTLVDLGNNAAASEGEILEVATRVGQATAQFKLGSANVLGIATAMKSLGINAEAGGTVIGQTFLEIQSAIDKGGEKMKGLTVITGKTADDLKKRFKEDATSVFADFVGGLGRLQSKGISVSQVLEKFGLSGDRINAIIPLMAGRVDLLNENLDRSNKAFSDNIALEGEFAEQTKSFNSAMTLFSNKLNKIFVLIGSMLAPVIRWFAEKLGVLLDFMNNHPGLTRFIVVFTAIVAIVGPLILAIGSLIGIITFLGAKAMIVVGIFMAVSAALAAVGTVIYEYWGNIKEFVGGVWDWISSKLSALSRIAKLGAGFLGFGGEENSAAPGAISAQALAAGAVNNTTTSNASVSVDFSNLPKGSRVSSKADKGMGFDISQGFMMATP